ncbi:MAG TPA: sigma 54-interacting transcriptional regulator [Terriglobales bacterium]|nr:sigma 54-interacting transcriptional regulator [Terriglobales bacterium]
MAPDRLPESEADLRRYEVLLEMADLMVHHGSLPELFSELGERLREVTSFDFANFSLHDPKENVMRLHIWAGPSKPVIPDQMAIDDVASGWVWENQQPLILPDLHAESRFPMLLDRLREQGLRSYCVSPLTTSQRRLGALGLASARPHAYSEKDLQLLRRVAELAALAIENALNRQALEEERECLHALVEVNQSLVSDLDVEALLPTVSTKVSRVVPHDFAGVALYEEQKHGMRAYVLAAPESQLLVARGELVPVESSISSRAFHSREMVHLGEGELRAIRSRFAERLLQAGIRSLLCVPMITLKGVVGVLNIGSRSERAFSDRDRTLLSQVAGQLAIAIDNARAYAEIGKLKARLAEEKLYLEDEIRTEFNFEEIVGESPALKRVLAQVKTVAPTDSTVLILGETGTGKELIARAIHRMSSRKDTSFIKVNCAAIPTGLLESELFGHEKGAFTGAISQKVGRLELADRGTIFLDEVGDIPLELQPKLLRALQDQEFERLGATRTLKVDVRLVAATNRDLAKGIEERQFRRDLYYRLNVFPISMPPLRERSKDIPLLVRYFVQKFARRMNKPIETIPTETMNALINWRWPGNVRELENFIERSVILTEGKVLRVPLAELQPGYASVEPEGTLVRVEREHIVRILRECGGVISGRHGAAVRLGMKRTTLQSRMSKLGISRADYEN